MAKITTICPQCGAKLNNADFNGINVCPFCGNIFRCRNENYDNMLEIAPADKIIISGDSDLIFEQCGRAFERGDFAAACLGYRRLLELNAGGFTAEFRRDLCEYYSVAAVSAAYYPSDRLFSSIEAICSKIDKSDISDYEHDLILSGFCNDLAAFFLRRLKYEQDYLDLHRTEQYLRAYISALLALAGRCLWATRLLHTEFTDFIRRETGEAAVKCCSAGKRICAALNVKLEYIVSEDALSHTRILLLTPEQKAECDNDCEKFDLLSDRVYSHMSKLAAAELRRRSDSEEELLHKLEQDEERLRDADRLLISNAEKKYATADKKIFTALAVSNCCGILAVLLTAYFIISEIITGGCGYWPIVFAALFGGADLAAALYRRKMKKEKEMYGGVLENNSRRLNNTGKNYKEI